MLKNGTNLRSFEQIISFFGVHTYFFNLCVEASYPKIIIDPILVVEPLLFRCRENKLKKTHYQIIQEKITQIIISYSGLISFCKTDVY